MPKSRKTDAWLATVQIAIPIDASDPNTAVEAKDWVERMCGDPRMPPGSRFEIVRAGFGKMTTPPGGGGDATPPHR